MSADAQPILPAVRPVAREGEPLEPSIHVGGASCVRFVSNEEREELCEQALRHRALVARPGPALPGKLGKALDAAVEAALARRGAMPPVAGADAEPRWLVSDQIFRAAALPARALVVCVPPLRALTERGSLGDDDATALLAWVDAARSDDRLTLRIFIEDADREICLRVPRPLSDLVDPAPWGPLGVRSQPPVDARRTDLSPPPIAPTLRPLSSDDLDEGHDLAEVLAISNDPRMQSLAPPDVAAFQESEDIMAMLEAERDEAERAELAERESERKAAEEREARRESERREAARLEAERAEAERTEAERAERIAAAAMWRNYAVELDAARGPRPAAQVERLFIERYIPLLGAVARGETDAAVRDIVRAWRDGFADSYEGAFRTIKVTGKRPAMVMDAPDIAHRVARLASARSVKLVLVDAMSLDLGERIAARLRTKLDKRAVLAEKGVLWAALPTTTPAQLHLLARGTQGFQDLPAAPSEPDVSRGRSVSAFRRERLGPREVLKLDLVEARLRGPGPAYDERLDAIADEVTLALLKLFDAMPPRTLVYVFGDHGFVLGTGPGQSGRATSAATQGGASPEEVLVSGQAWLVDAVQ
jgi:hypothetical protein